jgi:hypothetical protein
MDTVTDVTSFDVAALNYFTTPFQWQATKFERELGCTNASTAVIRWERTVLCSQWVNERWSVQCGQYYSESRWGRDSRCEGTSRLTSCLFSLSSRQIMDSLTPCSRHFFIAPCTSALRSLAMRPSCHIDTFHSSPSLPYPQTPRQRSHPPR